MEFAHKKSLGQNFLNNDYAAKKMCEAADLTAGETILEIGPGTGALTRELLAAGVQVIAIEADDRAVTILKDTFANPIETGALVIHHADVRNLDVASLGLTDQSFKVVANIPYYLSSFLFRTFLESDTQPNRLVFLVQKEVAERIAREEKESLLSVSVKVFGDPTYVTTIKKGHFTPQPKVDSAIIAVAHVSRDRLQGLNSKKFFELLQLGFGQKRKQLQGNLRKQFSQDAIVDAFTQVGLDATIRAEDVHLNDWIKLAKQLL